VKEKLSKKKIILIAAFVTAVIIILIVAIKMDSDTNKENGNPETTAVSETAENGETPNAPQQDGEEADDEDVTEPPPPPYATAKLSDQDVFITFKEADFYYNVTDKSIVSNADSNMYVSAKALSDTDESDARAEFNSLDTKSGLTDVVYAEKEIGGFTAKTATYAEGGKYYERCLITLDEPLDNIITAIQIDGCAGTSAENLSTIDTLIDTITIGPKEAE